MADGKVVIEVDVDGKGVTVLNNQLDQLDGKGKKASVSVKDLALSLGLAKIASAAFGVMKSSMDAAISRFDTFQRFPKVMGALGFSAEQSKEAINRLGDGIDGLPTKLDDVTNTAQRMTAITGNMNKSTNATIALNNAMLASGASADAAARGTDQYIKMLSTGKVEMDSWKTLQETMPIGLQKIAEALGYVGESAQTDLYNGLQSGKVSIADFQNKMIELGTGTGVLADLAKKNSEGIGTSFTNLRNSAAKGIANVIEALNDLSVEVTGNTIAQNIDKMKVAINSSFKALTEIIRGSAPVVKTFISLLSSMISVGMKLSPVLIGLAAAYATLKIITTVNSAIQKSHELLQAAAWSGKALTIVTQAQMAAQVANTTATKADIAAKGAQNGVITLGTALIGVMTGGITASTVATTLMTAATTAFGTAIKLLLGPISWVVAAVGALVTAGVALWKWLNKETEASKKLNAEQEKMVAASQQLNDSVKQNTANRKDNLSQIESSSKAHQKLAESVANLAEKENKSTTEKNLLKKQVEELNNAYEGLNLQYDAESGKLSMSNEQLQKRLEAYKNQEAVNESQQQLVDILTEQNEVEAKLSENAKLREEWNQKLADGSVKSKEAKEALKGLDEQETLLKENQKGLQEEYTNTKNILESSMAAVTQATEDGVHNQIISYETLSEAQKSAVDSMRDKWQEYKNSASDMFNQLSDEQKLSTAEMTKNLEENQRIMSQWADNIAALSARGLDEGLLNKLREAGPESAGYVAALVNSSDAEFQKLNEVASKAGETATNTLKTAFDTGGLGVNESIMNMVTGVQDSLRNSIAGADFSSIGANVGQGLQEGISQSGENAAQATGEVANKVSDAFTGPMQIKSPSRLFMQFGQYLIEGLAKGIENGGNLINSAMNRLSDTVRNNMQKIVDHSKETSNKIPEAFNSLPNSMTTVGEQIMQGLTNGIYSGSGTALAAARNIADQIKETIRSTMDIHSPSRWMRDEIGKYIPEGIAVGISDHANKAVKAMQMLSGNMQMQFTPEMALGANAIGNTNIDRRTLNNLSQSKTINNYQGMLDGAVFEVRNENDIPKLAKAIVDYQDSKNPNREPGVPKKL